MKFLVLKLLEHKTSIGKRDDSVHFDRTAVLNETISL